MPSTKNSPGEPPETKTSSVQQEQPPAAACSKTFSESQHLREHVLLEAKDPGTFKSVSGHSFAYLQAA